VICDTSPVRMLGGYMKYRRCFLRNRYHQPPRWTIAKSLKQTRFLAFKKIKLNSNRIEKEFEMPVSPETAEIITRKKSQYGLSDTWTPNNGKASTKSLYLMLSIPFLISMDLF
jgi:hypothetical protein